MRRQLLFLLLCIFLVMPTASAHSGFTDGKGGHYDRSTGKYHYHHGYSAHQHPGGVCPYGFNNKTGKNSGSSSSGNTSSATPPTQKPEPSSLVKSPPLVISAFALAIALTSVCIVVRTQKAKKEAKRKEAEQMQRIRQFKEMYDGKPFDEVFQPPSDFSVNNNGEPLLLGRPVLVSCWYDGPTYHKASCRYAPPAQKPMWQAICAGARPCKVCNPGWYDFSWYLEYLYLQEKLEKDGLKIVLKDGIMYLDEKKAADESGASAPEKLA